MLRRRPVPDKTLDCGRDGRLHTGRRRPVGRSQARAGCARADLPRLGRVSREDFDALAAGGMMPTGVWL
jgi:hypothetical protein